MKFRSRFHFGSKFRCLFESEPRDRAQARSDEAEEAADGCCLVPAVGCKKIN